MLWTNFKKMPSLLKLLTIHALAMSFSFIGSVIPFFSFEIDNKVVTFTEWWYSGAGIVASISGVLFPVAGYLFLMRKTYARITYVISIILVSLCHVLIFGLDSHSVVAFVLVLIAVTALASAYLYANKSVKTYFSSP